MGSSYFVTYGGNRVTFGGVPGPVAWEYKKMYSETLLWSGSIASGSLTLSDYPSAYDALRVVPGGDNQGNNSILYIPLEVTYRYLSASNTITFENPMFGATATSGVTVGWWFGGQLTGCSGKTWTFNYGYGRTWPDTGHSTRYDFARLRSVWGIKYGEL